MVLCCGTTTPDMKVNSLMVKWKEKESKPGPMETDMKACGLTIYNMVLDYSIMLKQIKKLQKNGEMEKDGLGTRPPSWQQVPILKTEMAGRDEIPFRLTFR